MLATQFPHITWLDALRYWLRRLSRPATALTIVAGPPAQMGIAVAVGRRFPISPQRAAYFYRAADEGF